MFLQLHVLNVGKVKIGEINPLNGKGFVLKLMGLIKNSNVKLTFYRESVNDAIFSFFSISSVFPSIRIDTFTIEKKNEFLQRRN